MLSSGSERISVSLPASSPLERDRWDCAQQTDAAAAIVSIAVYTNGFVQFGASIR